MDYFNGKIADLPSNPTFTAGPTSTFSQGFSSAYNEMTRNWAQYGLQTDFSNLEQQQLDKIYALTGKRLNPQLVMPAFTAMAKMFEGKTLTPGERAYVKSLQDQMQQVAEISKQHPDVLTYDQMWAQVKAAAHTAETTSKDVAAREGFGAWIGSFLGSMAGSFTTRDPLMLGTLAAGGVGRTAFARLATEFGFNTAIEAVDQFTGVQQNRELLGLDHSTGQAVEQSLIAGAGAGIFRGAGEGAAAIWRALRRRFGHAAEDVAVAGVRQEAKQVTGPSPFGDSRTADGVHWAELRSVRDNIDTPLFGTVRDRALSSVSLPALASRESDALFSGTPEPLSRILDQAPEATRDFGSVEVRKANTRIQSATDKINMLEVKANALDQRIAAVASPLPQQDTTRLISRLADVNKEIQDAPNLDIKAGQRKKLLSRLAKEKAAIEEQLSTSKKSTSAVRELTQSRDALRQQANDLRLQRAQIVKDVANRTPSVSHPAIDTSALKAELLSQAPSALPLSPIQSPVVARDYAEKVSEVATQLDEAPVHNPEIIPPKEGDAAGVEMVDLGGDTGPVPIDFPIATGEFNDAGEPITKPISAFLEDIKDDEDLVASMKACLVA